MKSVAKLVVRLNCVSYYTTVPVWAWAWDVHCSKLLPEVILEDSQGTHRDCRRFKVHFQRGWECVSAHRTLTGKLQRANRESTGVSEGTHKCKQRMHKGFTEDSQRFRRGFTVTESSQRICRNPQRNHGGLAHDWRRFRRWFGFSGWARHVFMRFLFYYK